MIIGVLGGGQLGRMLAMAALPLGVRTRFLDTSPEAPAAAVGELIVGDAADPGVLARFVRGLSLVTYEFENFSADIVEAAQAHVPVYPPATALRTGQDRLREKTLFAELGIAVPAFAPADSEQELAHALASIGTPCVVKTRRMGYDGKGQAVVRTPEDARALWARLGGVPLLVEAFVPFTSEVSIIGVRSLRGEVRTYPLVNNVHEGGILRQSLCPAPGVPAGVEETARAHMSAVLERLEYVGVLAIEFFEVGGGLLANEMAPRVHNSGHWTIEGAHTSQFENHIRAVCGMPLGDTGARGASMMLNIIGEPVDAPRRLAMGPRVHVHDYGKEPRAGRKVGHLTIVADTPGEITPVYAPVRG
ncbi:MAG: 5-(carboxyamino)imidazole ribonucleotide synthase [Phycisphaeraceae bacterium]|nr:5-(carboxyamino)imidazole ribonucleotide synthase [Phycisphaeraceae bacterium]